MYYYVIRWYDTKNNDYCESITQDEEQALILTKDLEKRGMQDVYYFNADAWSRHDADLD